MILFSFWGYGSIASEDEAHEPQEPGSNDHDQQGEAQLGHPLLHDSKAEDTVDERSMHDVHSTKPHTLCRERT